MPIFEYTCRDCGHEQQMLFALDGRVESVSCRCGSEAVRKFSLPGRVWAPTRTGQ